MALKATTAPLGRPLATPARVGVAGIGYGPRRGFRYPMAAASQVFRLARPGAVIVPVTTGQLWPRGKR